MAELPTGTVTFLFTDLEGSTRLWQEHPEAMRDALARHDAILRNAIESHHGHVVKTTGDGFHAAFATAHGTIDAAVAAQLALSVEDWRLPEPLRVRMGMHSGPAGQRDGDYYGTAVNRAARIMSAAHGGQIVVSLATEELVRDELSDSSRSSTSASITSATSGGPIGSSRSRTRISRPSSTVSIPSTNRRQHCPRSSRASSVASVSCSRSSTRSSAPGW